jgi:hypothetical protein
MSHNDDVGYSVNDKADDPSDFLCGSDQIGRFMGRTERQTFHLLSRGEIKSARKVGGRWVVNKAALLRELGA